MKVSVKLVEGLTFLAEIESGHGIVIDVKPEYGGSNLGASPMEVVLAGIAACTAFDIAVILRKMKQDFQKLEAKAEATRRLDYPRTFERIHLEYVVRRNVEEKKLERAIRLSQDKYCSASNMVKNGGVEISTSYKIIK